MASEYTAIPANFMKSVLPERMQHNFDITTELTFSEEKEKCSYFRLSEFGKDIQINTKLQYTKCATMGLNVISELLACTVISQ